MATVLRSFYEGIFFSSDMDLYSAFGLRHLTKEFFVRFLNKLLRHTTVLLKHEVSASHCIKGDEFLL